MVVGTVAVVVVGFFVVVGFAVVVGLAVGGGTGVLSVVFTSLSVVVLVVVAAVVSDAVVVEGVCAVVVAGGGTSASWVEQPVSRQTPATVDTNKAATTIHDIIFL